MALYRYSPTRPRLTAGPTKPRALVLALGFATMLAACGGGSDVPTDAATAAASDASRPVIAAPATAVAGAFQAASVTTSAATLPGPGPFAEVPTVAGKVRYGTPSAAAIGVGASLNGAVPFPIEAPWNRDVSKASVDPSSDALIGAIGRSLSLRPAFGPATGTPFVVIERSQPAVPVRLAGAIEPRGWPIPADAPISTDGAGLVIVVDRDAGLLFEMRGAVRKDDGSWDAAAGLMWRLDAASGLPTDGALDAAGTDAGLAVFPGLVRSDEAGAGAIRHALRVTVPRLRAAWLPPALRAAALSADAGLPPVGLRIRLKSSFVIPESASTQARAILQALKTYGMIVAGEGPAWAIDGVPDASWDTAGLAAELGAVTGEHFEALTMENLRLQ
jgi:hypothetical protein